MFSHFKGGHPCPPCPRRPRMVALHKKTPRTSIAYARKRIVQPTRRGNRKGQGRVFGGQFNKNKNPRDPITGPRGFVKLTVL